MNKSAQPDGTENKLKWIHSDGFLSDFCCCNLIPVSYTHLTLPTKA